MRGTLRDTPVKVETQAEKEKRLRGSMTQEILYKVQDYLDSLTLDELKITRGLLGRVLSN